jgi:hypothetical protein
LSLDCFLGRQPIRSARSISWISSGGFVEQIVIRHCLARLRVEEFLLDLRVHGQRHVDLLRQLSLLGLVFESCAFRSADFFAFGFTLVEIHSWTLIERRRGPFRHT